MMTQDSESIPIGISMTKGDSTIIPASRGSSSACSNPDSFKVAIIDSGVQVGHPDIPCLPIDDPDTNCKGVSIGIDGQPWYAPKGKAGHGTHVFGTIGAIGGNGEGVAGMVPNSDGICYLIGRVFGDEGNGQYASYVFEAIDWAISEKANVINISSSGPAKYVSGQLSFDMAYANGALTVASAGNHGSDAPQYPASFDHVLSVTAVKDDGERAYFSQYNDKVDVAAPGVNILSTTLDGRYATASGTSMAAPHITGAIAKVWSVCRDCSNIQVRECVLTTASKSSARTNELGFGMVSADKTYDCLVNSIGCCEEDLSTGVIADPQVEQLPAPAIDPELSSETSAATGCTRRADGDFCTGNRQCCSHKCIGSQRAGICQAVEWYAATNEDPTPRFATNFPPAFRQSASLAPSSTPSPGPSDSPSSFSSSLPSSSSSPSTTPSTVPSVSISPSSQPSFSPSSASSYFPSGVPTLSISPSSQPSLGPSGSTVPSSVPSDPPSVSISPSSQPSSVPSVSIVPSSVPSIAPSLSFAPSLAPSADPSVSTGPSSLPSSPRS
jgi:hypothetical protein